MSFNSVLLFFLTQKPCFASPAPPPILVLIIESINKRTGEAEVIETYGTDLEYQYKPSSSTDGTVSVSSGDGSKPKTASEKMQENMRKQQEKMRQQQERLQKNSKAQEERLKELQQQMIERLNKNLSDMKQRYSSIYSNWDQQRPEFERNRKKYDENLIDYNNQRKEEEERIQKEKERFEKEQEKLKELEEERKRQEEEFLRKKQKEEEERIQKEKEREEMLREEEELQKREELKRKLEAERRKEEASKAEEERKHKEEMQRKKAEEEALRKRQEEEEARLREQKIQEEKQLQEQKRQEEIRKQKSESAISWHIISGALDYPIRNQSNRGTCASFATIRAIELKSKQKNVVVDLSEQFFYWASKPECQDTPCSSQGSWPVSALEYGKKNFYPTEKQCPYSNRFVSKNDTQTPLSSSCSNQGPVGVASYEMGTKTSDIIGWLQQDHPVVIATTLTPNYYANEPWIDYQNREKGKPLDSHGGGHAYLLVGYVKLPKSLHKQEGEYCFVAANSWGEGWGKGGHACISERWLETYRIPNPYIAVTNVRLK